MFWFGILFVSRKLWAKLQCCFRDESPSEHKLRCCSVSSDCDVNTLPLPPGPPTSRPPSRSMQPQTDFDTLSEKYWGEILERTVSSNSLQALQRSYNQQHAATIASSAAQQYHQLGCLQSSVIDLSNGYHPPAHGSLRPLKKNHHQQPQHRHNHQLHQLVNKKAVSNLSNFSNSEPHLCDHYLHDINCAKNKLCFDDRHSIKGLPDI